MCVCVSIPDGEKVKKTLDVFYCIQSIQFNEIVLSC